MKLLIKNGRVIDPANDLDSAADILVGDGRISKVEKDISTKVDKVIDAAGKIVIPGIVDMHVHLREPGREDKETVGTGTKAALKGGVTSVLAMPNTMPAIDSPGNAEHLKDIIKNTANANVYICAAITEGRLGRNMTDIAGLKKAGVVAISDDGCSVDDGELFLEALKEAKKHDVKVICHSEDKSLSKDGVVNLGLTSTRLGLRGISRESEYKRIERDIELAKKADAPIHIAHVSCRESVEIIARAKKQDVAVTCETAPHYFALSEEAAWDYNTNTKINPPLRDKEDVEAVRQGLKNGTIDAIASDHAPHTDNEKDIEYERAEFGTIGLETELSLGIAELIENKVLDWPDLVRMMSTNPSKILGLKKGTLGVGADADIAVVDPKEEWILTRENIVSKSKNSPFIGCTLKGSVKATIYGGKIVYEA